MKNIQFTILPLILLSLLACRNNPDTSGKAETLQQTEDHHTDEHITLTTAQAKDAGITYGSFGQEEIKTPIEANGTIELPPNNMASISPLLDGFIEKIYALEGDVVKKGQVLVELKDPAYIRLQQDYLSVYGRLQYLEQELERQQILNDADVGAKKNLQQAQSEYQAKKSELAALKEQLNYAGISSNSLENGKIQNRIYLRAPFGGTVTSVSAHNGQKVMSGQEILQVINREHMHLELQLFQKDIPKVKEGQRVEFSIPAFDGSPTFEAEISLVGKNLNMESKTIRIHAHFKENEMLIPGLYVEANIIQEGKKARVLPANAIIRDKGTTFFFTKKSETADKISYEKVPFQAGLTSDELIEILGYEKPQDTTAIVLKGALTLKAEMNKSEGGHQD